MSLLVAVAQVQRHLSPCVPLLARVFDLYIYKAFRLTACLSCVTLLLFPQDGHVLAVETIENESGCLPISSDLVQAAAESSLKDGFSAQHVLPPVHAPCNASKQSGAPE